MYKVNFACLFFRYLNRNSHAPEHFTCTGTLPVPVHRYRGILRSLIKAGEGRETSNFAASPLNSTLDKTAILRRLILSSEPRAMSERVKLCKLMVKKEKRLIGAGSEKKLG